MPESLDRIEKAAMLCALVFGFLTPEASEQLLVLLSFMALSEEIRRDITLNFTKLDLVQHFLGLAIHRRADATWEFPFRLNGHMFPKNRLKRFILRNNAEAQWRYITQKTATALFSLHLQDFRATSNRPVFSNYVLRSVCFLYPNMFGTATDGDASSGDPSSSSDRRIPFVSKVNFAEIVRTMVGQNVPLDVLDHAYDFWPQEHFDLAGRSGLLSRARNFEVSSDISSRSSQARRKQEQRALQQSRQNPAPLPVARPSAPHSLPLPPQTKGGDMEEIVEEDNEEMSSISGSPEKSKNNGKQSSGSIDGANGARG